MQWENYEVYGRTVKLDCALNIPGLAMPIGLGSDGMPVGIMFHARPGDSPPRPHTVAHDSTCACALAVVVSIIAVCAWPQAMMPFCCLSERPWSPSFRERPRPPRWRLARDARRG